MVDPDASTRTEVPREPSDDGESSSHETDSFEGPYSPHTGDSTDEEELDYVSPADRLEHEVFTEEYRVAVKEYARLRRQRAIIAVGTASDEEIAQLKIDIEAIKRVVNEFRVLLQETQPIQTPTRRKTRKHKSRQVVKTSYVHEGTRSVRIPELGCDLAAAPIALRQAWYGTLLAAGKPKDKRCMSFDFASLMTVLSRVGVDISVGLAVQQSLFEEICRQGGEMSANDYLTLEGPQDPSNFSVAQRCNIYKALTDTYLYEYVDNPGKDEARKTNEYREAHMKDLEKIKQTGNIQKYNAQFMTVAQAEKFHRDPLYRDRIVTIYVDGLVDCFKKPIQMMRNDPETTRAMQTIEMVTKECRRLEGNYRLRYKDRHPDFYTAWFAGLINIIVNGPDRSIIECRHPRRLRTPTAPPRLGGVARTTDAQRPDWDISEQSRAKLVDQIWEHYRGKPGMEPTPEDLLTLTRGYWCKRCGRGHEYRFLPKGKFPHAITCEGFQKVTGLSPRPDRAEFERRGHEKFKLARKQAQQVDPGVQEAKNGDEDPQTQWEQNSDASINVTIGEDAQASDLGAGSFCYVGEAHGCTYDQGPWPKESEAPCQVLEPEVSKPNYFGAGICVMLTIVSVLALRKPLNLGWISNLAAGITCRDLTCVVVTTIVLGIAQSMCRARDEPERYDAAYRASCMPPCRGDRPEEGLEQPLVEEIDGYANVSFATEGSASCDMTTNYKAGGAVVYNSYVERAKKTRKRILDREQSKPPINRIKVCLTWIAVALYRKTCEAQGVLISPMLFDNCANRAFINYPFFLHLHKRGYITQIGKYTVDRFCNGSCGGKGRIWGWCILTVCTGYLVFDWCFEIVMDLGLDMILGCRFMEIAATTICYHDKMIYTRINNFAHEQQPKDNELPQVTVGYPQNGSVPHEPQEFARICFSKEEALYRQEFTVESMSKVTCPPKKINGDQYMKKAFTLRTFANYSVANATI